MFSTFRFFLYRFEKCTTNTLFVVVSKSLKNKRCIKPFSSYRASFDAPNKRWETVRIPFSDFVGKGPGAEDSPFDPSNLVRLGIVAIGKAMKVQLAVSGVRFYQ